MVFVEDRGNQVKIENFVDLCRSSRQSFSSSIIRLPCVLMNKLISIWSDQAYSQSVSLRNLTVEAGRSIMEVYNRDFEVVAKDDESPLTEADLASHHIILDGLKALPGPLNSVPIISEEGDIPTYEERILWDTWWLIDPLDGTKEFVKRNGEFTVNIALIVRPKPGASGIPIAGWVYAPVPNRLYEGILGRGAVRINRSRIYGQPVELSLPISKTEIPPRIVASRSHRTKETDAVIQDIADRHGKGDIVSSGSSLKLCQIAEGSAELYPRPAPTMEWDTGAADAVCRAAGARVVEALSGKDLQYGKENLLNPWFLVARDETLIRESINVLKNIT